MQSKKRALSDLPTYKIILLGDASVGKTCLCNKYITGDYE